MGLAGAGLARLHQAKFVIGMLRGFNEFRQNRSGKNQNFVYTEVLRCWSTAQAGVEVTGD